MKMVNAEINSLKSPAIKDIAHFLNTYTKQKSGTHGPLTAIICNGTDFDISRGVLHNPSIIPLTSSYHS